MVLFPFNVPVPIPLAIWNGLLDALGHLRVIQQRQSGSLATHNNHPESNHKFFRIRWVQFLFNYLTAPLIAVLFLLATTAITRKEVYNGTVGTDNIYPLEIMAFFITLAYIAISIDASGLIRWLSLKVLRKGGKNGRLLFLYLYLFFFGLASFIGNDPIVLSGTPFLAYMTRLSSNIRDPKAWIYTQFSVANIASAILVTSNPTNLVLAGAFDIKFIDYTANMIVPVIITVVLFFPFLLFGIFRDETLIPRKIEMHESPTSSSGDKREPTNPNIPFAGGITEEDKDPNTEAGKLLSIDEVMDPYLDKKSAIFASAVMAVTLVTVLAVNAASTKAYPAYWITAPAAFVVLCWDVVMGWRHRRESRRISREGRGLIERRRAEEAGRCVEDGKSGCDESDGAVTHHTSDATDSSTENEKPADIEKIDTTPNRSTPSNLSTSSAQHNTNNNASPSSRPPVAPRTTLTTLASRSYLRISETFPTATTVLTHLPFPLVPFGLCMFILVEALVSAGWIQCFAWGWNDWVNLTGTVGAIGGMGVLGVVLCNVSPPPALLPRRTETSRLCHVSLPCLTLRNVDVEKQRTLTGRFGITVDGRHKHRHHNPPLPPHSVLASHSPNTPLHTAPHHNPHLRSHNLRPSSRPQLRSFLDRVLGFLGRDALAQHPRSQAYLCREVGVCEG